MKTSTPCQHGVRKVILNGPFSFAVFPGEALQVPSASHSDSKSEMGAGPTSPSLPLLLAGTAPLLMASLQPLHVATDTVKTEAGREGKAAVGSVPWRIQRPKVNIAN